jgi:electron transfer flavoprotein beta subunit
MHIAVCLKQVLDPEIPAGGLRLIPPEWRADAPGATFVMGIFDANALETALKLRDAVGAGSTVTALSVGDGQTANLLRKALAVTANAALLISDPALRRLDPAGTATVIAAAVRRMAIEGHAVDLVLTGRQAADWEHGQTGGMVAEALGWPCVTFVSRLSPTGESLELRREVEEGFELVRAQPPLVLTITNDDTNQLRLPKVRDVIRAQRVAIPTWGAAELQLSAADVAPLVDVVDAVVPHLESRCEMLKGETPAEVAAALARRLKALNVL